jgi:hypothetical protein
MGKPDDLDIADVTPPAMNNPIPPMMPTENSTAQMINGRFDEIVRLIISMGS